MCGNESGTAENVNLQSLSLNLEAKTFYFERMKKMRKELAKGYEPQKVEKQIYDMWQEKGYFHAKPNGEKKPFSIVIPPPNITGQLHMGHALDNTLQDILIRVKRMQGYEALWMPGTDHAAIATEAKIVAAMKEEGLTKEGIGREAFMERAWDWKEKYADRIVEQLKTLGSSCDWDRLRFTMDEGCSKAVKEVFVKLYNKGLIYRGERIINWCPTCKTALSDAEVEFEDQAGHFWHINYPFKDGSGYLEIATTRPETLLGDTAVAVNPNDERYKDIIGKMLVLPLVGREIPVIADDYVEMDFGTGCVKITPAHDPNDFEVGLRHNLEVINVMTEDAHINENGGKYCGLDRFEARKVIIKDLEEAGVLVKTEAHAHNVGTCYRCHTTVEPRVSKQWFVKMKPLTEPAVDAVKSGEIKFVPERFSKTYYHWMENIRDWCISRQIWWGHRIPAFYCDGCGEITVSDKDITVCPKCGGKLRQDEDTLDTWFSSALWPFSTMGWPEETEEFKYFYPTDVLVTGYDIIFFWVSRMIFSGIEHTGEIPFKTVLIHGLVRDELGRKMSKSLGNGVDPLEVIAEYGADALRFNLVTGNAPGNDMRYLPDKVKASANFANKIWNAARFVLMNLPEDFKADDNFADLTREDKWILNALNELVKEVTDNIEKFELGIALAKIYDFMWDNFCDWYIELSKPRISAGENGVLQVLVYVLTNTLKLLHPFMPYVTEELWQAITDDGSSIMVSAWPIYNEKFVFTKEAAETERMMEAIRMVRSRRSEMNVAPSKKAKLYIETDFEEEFKAAEAFFIRLASASEIEVGKGFEIKDAVTVVSDGAKIYIPLDELVDREKEMARLNKEKSLLEADIAKLSSKLSNEGFVAKAPAAVVEAEKAKLAAAEEKLSKVNESLAKL